MSKGSISILATYGFVVAIGISSVIPAVVTPSCWAQEASPDLQGRIAERFMQVLMRRPSPGTALDRVYAYHVQSGTLDDLLIDLQSQDGPDDPADPDAGARYMILGLLQMQRGREVDALDALAKAERLRPDDAMVSFYYGKALLSVGKIDDAALALERATQRRPPRNEALRVFTELGRLYQRGQQSEKALSVWRRLEELFPGDARVAEQIAQTLSEEGEQEAALERYEQLAKRVTDTDGQRAIGYRIAAAELKRELGRTDDAIADFESLLEKLRPSSWLYSDVRRRIEAGFLRGGDYAALADYYARQVEKNPDQVDCRLRLGRSLAKAGRLNEAVEVLQKTTQLAPLNADARSTLVDVLMKSGDAKSAAEQLELLIEQDPANPDLLVRLGNTWLADRTREEAQRRAAAAEAWQKLADTRREDAVVTTQVADLMRGIERTDDALALYRHAIELSPEQPQYREYLGEYLHELDRKQEALAAWDSIAEGSRENRENLIRLAEVLNTFGHQPRALEAFAKASKLDPTFAQRLRFSILLLQADRFEDSLAQLDLAQEFAETPEEFDQLLQSRLEVYQLQGVLYQRIAEASVRADQSKNAGDYRRLALMYDAASKLAAATHAIEQAMQADPSDTTSLATAAELYRKSSRLTDAITAYRELAKRQPRFLPNYLKRIASLQMDLGEVDEARETAEQLVAAQPGNPESHRFYAGLCFRAGLDEEGIERLRLAVRAAPRDDGVRRALAQALAARFRTDEAMELYWQILDEQRNVDDQFSLIKSLADLYEQKGSFSLMVDRLERRGREQSDMRSAILLLSAAHQATNDLGRARELVQQLLSDSPRDAELLRRMVDLSEVLGESDVALQYQKRLTALADTPEDRNRLTMLLVDSGEMTAAEASLSRLQADNDHGAIVELIDRMARRGEVRVAIRFCRAVLDRDSDLWEVRSRLAAYLFMTDQIEEAVAEAEQVEAMNLLPTTLAASGNGSRRSRGGRFGFGANRTGTPNNTGTPTPGGNQNASQNSLGVARWYRAHQAPLFVDALRSAGYVSSLYSRGGTDVIAVRDYSHARFLALTIRMAAARRDGDADPTPRWPEGKSLGDAKDPESSNNLDQLWTAYNISVLRSALDRTEFTMPTAGRADIEWADRLRWRLASVDADACPAIVHELLASRHQMRLQVKDRSAQFAALSLTFASMGIDPSEPLNRSRLEVARQAYQEQAKDPKSPYAALLATALHDEFLIAEQADDAKQLRSRFDPNTADPRLATKALEFYGSTKRPAEVEAIVDSIGQQLPQWAPRMKVEDQKALASALASVLALETLDPGTLLRAADLYVATQSLVQRQPAPGSAAAMSPTGAIAINSLARAKVPMFSRLMSTDTAKQFYSRGQFLEQSDQSILLTEHLHEDVAIFPNDSPYAEGEQKLRQVLCSFTRWWLGDLAGAYESIVLATESFPDDDTLWIERARLADELGRPEASLEALQNIETTDHLVMQVREMAILNLAPRLGKLDRARVAAQRLRGMRLSREAETALVKELNRLGMNEMATSVLRRTQRRGGHSPADLLNLADSYLKADEIDAAGQAAYRALQGLIGKTKSTDVRNRSRAITLLRRCGRIDPMIAAMEQRVAAAPKSLTLKLELAELYSAVGKRNESNALHKEIVDLTPKTPRSLWKAGDRLVKSRNYEGAVEKYVEAIEMQPSLLSQHSSEFSRAVSGTRYSDKAFEALMRLDLDSLDRVSISRLASLYRSSRPRAPAKNWEAFFGRLVQRTPTQSLATLLAAVNFTSPLRKHPSLETAIKRVFADERTYLPSCPLWQSGSRSSKGDLLGALRPCVSTVRQNEKLKASVASMISKRMGRPETETTAALLQLLMNVPTSDVEASDVDTIEDQLHELLASDTPDASYQLWWQAGQLLAEQKSLEPISIRVFEHARDTGSDESSSYYFSTGLGAKLISIYTKAGEKEKAREELVRSHRRITLRLGNKTAPSTYQSYRDLLSIEKIAANLLKVDAPLDALRVYNDALARPQVFEMAKVYARGKDYAASFRSSFRSTANRLTEDDYAQFLELATQQSTGAGDADAANPAKLSGDPALELMPLKASTSITPQRSSIAAIAICGLSESEGGRAKLRSFDQLLEERAAAQPKDCSLLAARCMIASKLDSEEAGPLLENLASLVEETAAQRRMRPYPFTRLLDLYSTALVALQSERDSVRVSAGTLVDALVAIARHREKTDVLLTLTVAKLDSIKSDANLQRLSEELLGLLESLVPANTQTKVVSTEVAKQCLQVAEIAADAGAVDASLEALRRGFGGGPAYQRASSHGFLNPFASPQPRSSVTSLSRLRVNTLPLRTTSNTGGSKHVPQILAILQKLESSSPSGERPEPSAMYRALQEIVFPNSRRGEVFPYAADVIAAGLSAGNPTPNMSPASVSASLCHAAIASGKQDELRVLLDGVNSSAESRRNAALVRAQLAFAEADDKALDHALADMARLCDMKLDVFPLPPRILVKPPGDPGPRLSESDWNARYNLLLHAILPVHQRDGVTAAVAEVEFALLSAASRRRSVTQIWDWMGKELVLAETVSDPHAKRIVDACVELVSRRYRTSSGNEGRKRSELLIRELAQTALQAKRYELAGSLLRRTLLVNHGLRPKSDFMPQVALGMMQLDLDSQYRVLSTMVLGDNGKLASAAAVVRFVEAPRAFHSVLPSLPRAREVSIGNPNFPITSTSLMLADVAARSNLTDELIGQLQKYVAQPGGEAAAMIGQALLAAERIKEANEILERIDSALVDSLSTQSTKAPMPIESALFLARCLSEPSLQEKASVAWGHLMSHPRRSDIRSPVSFLNRVAASLETDRANPATQRALREHWIRCQVPYKEQSVFAGTEPICIVRDGVLHLGSGADQSLLMLKYPLAGDFKFSHTNLEREMGDSHCFYGGTAYISQSVNPTLTIMTVDGRTIVHSSNKAVKQDGDNLNELVFDGPQVGVTVNGTEMVSDQRTVTMPFVGLHFLGEAQAAVGDLRIDGAPTVLREVKPIGPQLRGWSCPILAGYLINAHLPLGPTSNVANVDNKRKRAEANAESQTTWFERDGELRSGKRSSKSNAGGQRHIQYLRPLIDDETMSYRFFYEAGQHEVHPSIGRVVFLLRPDGVKLRWLADDRSLESFQISPLHEVDPTEVLGDGVPLFREGEWNDVTLLCVGNMIELSVNGKSICRTEMSIDQRFGVLCEEGRQARIRDLKLVGPWPETLPASLAIEAVSETEYED